MTDQSATDRPSVLLDFRATNVRSFRDPFALSLQATTLTDPSVVRPVEWALSGQSVDVVPATAVFGPNGSGKTNLLRAMHDMRSHVLHSFRHAGGPTAGVPRRPFLLDESRRADASSYELDLVLKGVRHEYSFTVDDQQYLTERCYHFPRGRRSLLFERDGDAVVLGSELKRRGRSVIDILRRNALFLSTAAYAGHPLLTELYGWFSRNLILADARTRAHRQGYTTNMIFNERRRESVLGVLRLVDPGIVEVRRKTVDPVMQERMRRAVRIVLGQEDEPDGAEESPLLDLGVRLAHQGAAGGAVDFDSEDESLGTLVWYGVAGPIIDALADGCVFLADEIDASLHPELTRQLVRVFQDHRTNPRRAQLIFNSHDTTLLGDSDNQLLGRDQVWLVSKGADGASHLAPLADFSPRKDASLSKRYLAGHYGALPGITDADVDQAVLTAIELRHA